MAVQVTYPGVYIDEVTSAGAISGVGTSTAAFLGAIKYGRRNEAVRITSWDSFLKEFWRPQEQPDDIDYLWYSVKGFFENGGKTCFVINVSDATPDWLKLQDRLASPDNPANTTGSAKATIRIFARTPGASSGISVQVQDDSLVSSGKFFRPSASDVIASASSTAIVVGSEADAAQFRVGDVIRIDKGTGTNAVSDASVIVRVDATAKKILTATDITHTYSGVGATLTLENLATGTNSFRAKDVKLLSVGSSVKITQGAGANQKLLFCRVVAISPEVISSALITYRVTVDQPVDIFKYSNASEIKIESNEFKVNLKKGTNTLPGYTLLAMDPGHPNYFATIINNDPDAVIYAEPVEPPNTTIVPDNRPIARTSFDSLGGGSDQSAQISGSAYVEALKLLGRIDDVNLVMAPGRADDEVQLALIEHCTRQQDRIALLGTDRSAPLFGAAGAEGRRLAVDSDKGYAAFYYPWLLVPSMKSGNEIPIPPTGHVAGIIARTDAQRGVHKAPAGTAATVSGVLGVAQGMSNDEQGILNKAGINVIRVFQSGGRSVVWGARTTAPEGSDWQYVSTRRLFLFIEESIQESIRWAVFEPNNIALWEKLKRVIRAFLRQQWRDGALFGETEELAFYVRIDEGINPESERQLGRLNIEIGIKPAFPAEFIIIRIGVWQGGSQVLEG
jgi:uncharacterized protein